MSPHTAVMILLCIAPGLSSARAQSPPQQQPPAGPPANPPDKPSPDKPENKAQAADQEVPVVKVSAADATRILHEQEKALAGTSRSAHLDALKVFLTQSHESFVKPIAALLKDPEPEVVKAALKALGSQVYESSSDALLDFATNPKRVAGDPELVAEALHSLQSTGMSKRAYPKLRENYDRADKTVKREMLAAFVKAKEKRAFTILVDMVDEPHGGGKDPSSPAEIKKKWEVWNECKVIVRKGLKDLTGEGMASASQYIEWAAGPGKKLGFEYKKGN